MFIFKIFNSWSDLRLNLWIRNNFIIKMNILFFFLLNKVNVFYEFLIEIIIDFKLLLTIMIISTFFL